MEQAILSTIIVLVGLMILNLLLQLMNHVKLTALIVQQQVVEKVILGQLLNQTEQEYVPVSMEDLIMRDLEEQMATSNQQPMTDAEAFLLTKEMEVTPTQKD